MITKLDKKVLKKKYGCLRHMTLSCGQFYSLERGAEAVFVFYTVLRTIDVLLALDE